MKVVDEVFLFGKSWKSTRGSDNSWSFTRVGKQVKFRCLIVFDEDEGEWVTVVAHFTRKHFEESLRRCVESGTGSLKEGEFAVNFKGQNQFLNISVRFGCESVIVDCEETLTSVLQKVLTE